MKKIILTILSILTLSFASISCAVSESKTESGLNLFGTNVQPLVEKFINNENPKEKDLVDILNKEFGKEIVKVEIFEGKDFIEKNKNITLSENELNKLKSITKYLSTKVSKGASPAFVGIVEMEFDY